MSRRIAVLSLISDLGENGNTDRLFTFATHVDGERFAHTVVTIHRGQRTRGRLCGNARQRFADANINVQELGEHPVAQAGQRDKEIAYTGPRLRRIVGKLCRVVQALDIDVIDAHRSAAGLVAVMAGAITGTPVMLTPHTPYATVRSTPRRASWLAGQMGMGWADALVAGSMDDRNALERWLLKPGARRIAVVPSGVEAPVCGSLPGQETDRASALAHLAMPADAGLCVIGLAGSLAGRATGRGAAAGPLACDRTEAAWLLRAAQPVMAQHGHVHAVLPGRELPAELGALATQLGIAGRVHVMLPQSARTDLLPLIDIVVAGAGAAPELVLESMALARPIVATARGAAVDFVEHQVSGMVVPVGDARAAARVLAELVAEPGAARRLGQAARARYLEQHTPAIMARRLEGLLSELAAERRTRTPATVDRGQIFGLGRILESLQTGR